MFFKKKFNVIFRDYQAFGYITDNRNFGYKLSDSTVNYIGDKILSESGAVFMSVLDKKPQSLEVLVKKIKSIYRDIDRNIIMNDAREFYFMLEQEGFVVSGNTSRKCNEKDKRFSYSTSEPQFKENYISSSFVHTKVSTEDFFNEYFKGKPQLTNLHIEITSKCNEKCVHCYIPEDDRVSYIDSDLFYDVIEQCKNMRLLHLTISGGEPMLHKNFCDFLKKCNEHDFSINVLSNLTLLNDEIIKEMRANPLLGVQVSLYSMDSDIHDEITRTKGSFLKTTSAILRLIENDIPLQICCPIMQQNKNCYKEVIEWAKTNKIHVIDDYTILAKYNHSTENINCRLSIDEIEEIIDHKISNNSGFLEQIEKDAENKLNTKITDPVCSVCHSSICISDNGNVYPCAGWQSYVVANVKETSLNDIWNNSEKIQYLRGINNQEFPKCIKCPDKEFCTICMVRNANENPFGNPFIVSEYFCDVARLNRRKVIEWKQKNLLAPKEI